jgi:hypothetical protein
MQLTPVSYRFKDFPAVKQRDIGFSAQQLKALFPSFVHASPGRESGYPALDRVYSVDYGGLSVLAVKMIQEQQTMITGLRERISILRRQIEELESLSQ